MPILNILSFHIEHLEHYGQHRLQSHNSMVYEHATLKYENSSEHEQGIAW